MNECRPQMLIYAVLMAIHPHPYNNMLIPMMDSNLAMISHTFVA